MKELKPFDLEAAKRGEPVCLFDGTPVHFVGVSLGGRAVTQGVSTHTLNEDSPHHLRMAPKKRTVWVNIHSIEGVAAWYDSKNKAESMHAFGVSQGNSQAIAIAVPVEIEE